MSRCVLSYEIDLCCELNDMAFVTNLVLGVGMCNFTYLFWIVLFLGWDKPLQAKEPWISGNQDEAFRFYL